MMNRIGPHDSGKVHPNPHGSSLPPELASVQLVDAKTAAASGGVSLSWWFDKVAAGQAPKPAFRGSRCTRWRVGDVAEFWRTYGQAQGLQALASTAPPPAPKTASRVRKGGA